ncbi:MAG: hypothetical protein ABGZ17_07845 [Planctomycetaceae bacterium]
MQRITITVGWLLAGVLLDGASVQAQQAPTLGYVFPPALSSGSERDVVLGGYDLTPDVQLFVHDARLSLNAQGSPGEFFVPGPPYWFGPKGFSTAIKIPREIPARLRVAEGCPPGLFRWQLANANGGASTAVVLVSDRPEIVEDRFRQQPQELPSLPIGVSGRLSRISEVDRYRLKCDRDGPISIELFARRLGANFNGVIQVRDEAGRLLVDQADTLGIDAAATFGGRAGTSYHVSLHDVDFRGHRSYVYRLAITAGPRVLATIPAAGRRGSRQKVEFIGIGVATGAARLESTTRDVTFPKDVQQASLRYRLETPSGIAAAVDLPLGHLPELRDADRIEIPAATTAVMHADGCSIRFAAKKSEVLRIDAVSQLIGTAMDLSLSIRDTTGKQIAENDDLPGSADAGLDFVVPADAEYLCVVRDLSGRRVDQASVFRLAIDRPQPDFRLSVPQVLNLPVAGKTQLVVKAVRLGGFQDEIAIQVTGLPEGVTVAGDLKIPAKKNDLKIELTSAKDAAVVAATMQLTGQARIGDQIINRPGRAAAGGNLCPTQPPLIEQVLLVLTMKPPFALELVDKNRQRAVHRGTTYPAEFVIKRDAGFKGEVQLMMASSQSRHRQGIHGPIVTVPADAQRALYPSFMPEWLATDRTTRMSVLGAARVADPQGNLRYVTRAANARITMILEGALLKVSHQLGELTVSPGGQFEIPVTIARSTKLREPVTVSLEVPDELAGAVQCSAVTLDRNQSTVALRVHTTGDQRLAGRWPLTIRATTKQDERWLVMSQTQAVIEFAAATQ